MKSEILAIILIVLLPFILLIIALKTIKSKYFLKRANIHYQISIFKSNIITSEQTFHKIGVVMLMFFYYYIIVEFPAIITIICILVPMGFLYTKKIEPEDIKEASNNIFSRLVSMENELSNIKQHFDLLKEDIHTKQIEINEKEAYKSKLENEISKKKNEATIWESMTLEQKNWVITRASEAMTRTSKRNLWVGIITGFLINILAAFIWNLFVNPEDLDILKKIENIVHIFN